MNCRVDLVPHSLGRTQTEPGGPLRPQAGLALSPENLPEVEEQAKRGIWALRPAPPNRDQADPGLPSLAFLEFCSFTIF